MENATPTSLRGFLDARGVRYGWVADQLGVSRGHFSLVLSGARPLTGDTAAALAALFGVPAETFLEGGADRDDP